MIYFQRDNIINGVKSQMINTVTESIQGMLPNLVDGAMPELPGTTGGAVPSGLPF